MKIRVYIAKAITSIVNLDRYAWIFNEIFENFFKENLKTKEIDHNNIHGLLEVLKSLAKKYNIFQFISFEAFFAKLQILAKIKQ